MDIKQGTVSPVAMELGNQGSQQRPGTNPGSLQYGNNEEERIYNADTLFDPTLYQKPSTVYCVVSYIIYIFKHQPISWASYSS